MGKRFKPKFEMGQKISEKGLLGAKFHRVINEKYPQDSVVQLWVRGKDGYIEIIWDSQKQKIDFAWCVQGEIRFGLW